MHIKLRLASFYLPYISNQYEAYITCHNEIYYEFIKRNKSNCKIGDSEIQTVAIQIIKTYVKNKNNYDYDNKNKIIKLFNDNVKGKKYSSNGENKKHAGKEGHWLEKQFGIIHNSKNAPDIYGYELKKESDKISFGDWSASEYLFSTNQNILSQKNGNNITISKEEFIKSFGNKTKGKDNRYSWSGSCIPKYNKWNDCGQILDIDDDNNICIYYLHEHDVRDNKLVKFANYKKICIAIWSCEKMKKLVNSKFNHNGFVICSKNKNGVYNNIKFGQPFDFKLFIQNIKNGKIYFDSGMYFDNDKPNNRSYSQWRANKNFWTTLITEEY